MMMNDFDDFVHKTKYESAGGLIYPILAVGAALMEVAKAIREQNQDAKNRHEESMKKN